MTNEYYNTNNELKIRGNCVFFKEEKLLVANKLNLINCFRCFFSYYSFMLPNHMFAPSPREVELMVKEDHTKIIEENNQEHANELKILQEKVWTK